MEKNWVLAPVNSIFKGCREQISSSKLCTLWPFCTCTSGGYQSIQPESSLIPSGLEPTTFPSEEGGSGSELQKWALTSPESSNILIFPYTETCWLCVQVVGNRFWHLLIFRCSQLQEHWEEREERPKHTTKKLYHQWRVGWHLLWTGISQKPPGMVQTFTELFSFWRVLDKNNHAQSSVDKVLLKSLQRISSVRQVSGKYFLHFRVHKREVAEHILVHAVNQCSVSTGQSGFFI